ncbi:hypothetical protein ACN267_23450 [Micromonospora sp. WMMD734]|uniref:Uncharacterized protein n=1 Tax=Micromonospora humidisoli TaxID=2807622 RepID=A0ABS2JA25_9ACTN|nr:hypothetical protein [Micromonospora humidisoli]MBM7083405.1 hypothetical protein [Micromonospora humidisoli]
MNEALAEMFSGSEAMAAALVVAGTAAGLIRACVTHRTRLQEEREASTRTAARMSGLVRLAATGHDLVRIVERDRDGHREVELGACGVQRCETPGETA